jgi:phage recombination protein Bet
MSDTLAPVTLTPDQLDLVKRTVAMGATDAELKLYLYDCQRQGVHPLDRLLHFTKRGGKYTPVTSIDLMRIRAAETNEYAGSDDAVLLPTDDQPLSATVTVWRMVQGQRCPFTATARWKEYCPPAGQDHMWRKMPATMLAKCAEALALRKGFPRQLAGLYAREELDQAGTSNGKGESFSTETGEVFDAAPVQPVETPPDPDGFDAHWAALQQEAPKGFPALAARFNKTPERFRQHVMRTRSAEWIALKTAARLVADARS